MAQRTHVLLRLAYCLRPLLWPCFMLLLATTLVACGGTRVLQETLPTGDIEPIAATTDKHVRLSPDTLHGLHLVEEAR